MRVPTSNSPSALGHEAGFGDIEDPRLEAFGAKLADARADLDRKRDARRRSDGSLASAIRALIIRNSSPSRRYSSGAAK